MRRILCSSWTQAIERIRAARKAIDKAGGDTLLVGRAECFLVGQPDIDLTIARLKAYANAGADCLYAPGIRTTEQIAPWSPRWRRNRSICWSVSTI